MATNTLTNNFIALTYQGVLHARGEQLPSSGQVQIYDGQGNTTPIIMGRKDAGASIYSLSASTLSAAGLAYPHQDGTANQVMLTNGSGRLSFGNVSDLFNGISKTIASFSTIKITVSNGIITSLEGNEERAQHRTFAFTGSQDNGQSTYPSTSLVASFLQSIWSTAQNNDEAQVIYFKANRRQQIRDVSFRPRQYIYNLVRTGGAWAIKGDQTYPIEIDNRGATNVGTFTPYS